MKRYALSAGCLLSMVLLLSSCGADIAEAWDPALAYGNGHTQNTVAEEDLRLYAENDRLALWIDENTTAFTVVQKDTGRRWSSADPESEAGTAGHALMALTYLTPGGTLATVDTMSACVADGQYTCEKTDDGAEITYCVGEMTGQLKIPLALSEERFAAVCESIGDEFSRARVENDYRLAEQNDAELIGRYPLLAQQPLYILSDTVQASAEQQKRLAAILQEAGYDAAQYQADSAFFPQDGEEEETPVFRVVLRLRLTEDELIVTVPGDELRMRSSYPLTSIDLLPRFGAPARGDDGYFLLPDGSGALMRYYNGKGAAQAYVLPLYGMDDAQAPTELVSPYPEVYLPVFGMKNGDSAVLATIGEGDAIAEIRAFPGSDSGCAYVNAAFSLRATCRSALQTGKANDYFTIAQSKRYTGDLTVRYAFLSGEQADYNGMAAYVQRQIFCDSEPLTPEAPPVVTEYVGLIRKTESFLGLSYEKKVPMTTFAQVAEHTADLQANGLRGLRVKLSGWFGGGYLHGFAGGARAERALGGLAGAQALAERLRQDGVPLFFDADIQYTYDRSLGDGFSVRRDTVRLLDHGAGSVYPYDRATMQRDSERTGYIHTPQATARALSGYLDSLSAVGDVGLSLRHAGNKIAADYSEKQPADRQTALESLTAAVAQAAGQRSLMIGGANARILPYADICLDLPLTSSGSSLTDESVPFLPMVLSGYVRFTGTARSLEGDREGQLLHLAQTAGGLAYVLTAQNGREVTDGPCAFLYSTDFAYWRSDLLQTAVGYQSALDGLSGRRIVRYDRVGDGVYRTTFAGGATVTVNYGDSAVTVDGEPLSARSFTVRNGQEG